MQGHNPATTWPGLNTPAPAQNTPQPSAPAAGWLAAPVQRAASAGGSFGGAVTDRGSSAAGGRQSVAAGGVGGRAVGGTPGAGGLKSAGGSGAKMQVTQDADGTIKMTAWLD